MAANSFLSDEEWRDLLLEIHNRQVIPVAGPELVTVSLTPGSPPVPLHRALAPRLAEALGVEAGASSLESLNRVACYHLLSGGQRKRIYMEVSQLLEALEKEQRPAPAALHDLASITDFDLYIAGTIDHFLAAALEQTRPGFQWQNPGHVLAYNYKRPVDIPDKLGPALVYHLVGHRATYPNFAVWEEDYLEFICGLIQHQPQLPNLFRLLRSRFLLLLGTPFADWIVRFFLFLAKGGRFSDHRKDELVAYLADRTENLGDPLIFFFDRVVGTTKVIPGDSAAFVGELARRWRAAYLREDTDAQLFTQMPVECPRGAVFISYSRDDQGSVARLVRGLRGAQIPVWVDQERLSAGENYERSLEFAVKSNCSFFLSVISQATEGNPARYVHRERRWAAQRHVEGFVFYVPVIIDDTAQPAAEPAEFARIQIERLPGGAVTGAFANRLSQLVEDYRAAGQPRA